MWNYTDIIQAQYVLNVQKFKKYFQCRQFESICMEWCYVAFNCEMIDSLTEIEANVDYALKLKKMN